MASALEGLFAQLSAEGDVDAIADQIGALSVDEVASAVEGLFAQLEADDEDELAQLSAEDTLDDMVDVAFNVGMAVAPMAASGFAQVE